MKVPTGWTVAAFGEVMDGFQYGLTARASERAEGTRFLRITDIQNGSIDWSKVPGFLPSGIDTERYRLTPGDFLFARSGATVGKAIRVDDPPESVFASYLIRFASQDTLLSDWVNWFIKSPAYFSQVRDAAAGIGMPNISAAKLKQFRIPIPPHDEIHGIIGRLKFECSHANHAKASIERIGPLARRYWRALLSAAFDWQGHGWQTRTLAELSVSHDGRRIPLRANDRAKRRGAYPYFGASGQIDTIDEYRFDGDFLLVSEDGANLLARRTPIAFTVSGKFWVNNHAHVLAARPMMNLEFLRFFVESLDLAPFVTGTAQPKLTQRALSSLQVPVPPLSEQSYIVGYIERARSCMTAAATDADRSHELLERYERAILSKAFSGTLPRQDQFDQMSQNRSL